MCVTEEEIIIGRMCN